jgi:hypothetical protein
MEDALSSESLTLVGWIEAEASEEAKLERLT